MCIYFFLLCSMPPGDRIGRQNVNFHTYADDDSIVDLYWAFVWAERTTCSAGVCTVHGFHCKFCYLFISNQKAEYKHTEYKKISVQKGTGRSETFIIQPPFLLIDNKTVLLNQITAKYTVDIQTIVFHLRTRGTKGVVPACMPAKTPMQQMSPIFILCVWIIAVHHAVWRVSHRPV